MSGVGIPVPRPINRYLVQPAQLVCPTAERGIRDELVGIVTDRDLVLRVLAEGQDPSQPVSGDLASRSPVSIGPDEKLSEARDIMEQHRVRRLPVMKDGRLVGILSLGDVAWQDASAREVGETLRQVSRSESTRDANEGPDRGNPHVGEKAAGTAT